MSAWSTEARFSGRWRYRRTYLRGYGEDYARVSANRHRWWARFFAWFGL